MRRRLCAKALTLLLLLTLLPLPVRAAVVDSGSCGDHVSWTLDSDGTLTLSGYGPMEDYSYEWDGSDLTPDSLPAPWWEDPRGIENIIIGNGITRIGDYAFAGCNMDSITIPDSVTSIGEYAFYLCISMTSVTIPDSVTDIRSHAFAHCYSLESVTIPDSITRIEEETFAISGLESVTIPDSITSIGWGAFAHPYDVLTDVFYGGSKAQWQAISKKSFIRTDVQCADGVVAGDDAPTSGQCGENTFWNLENGVLTISGTGPIGNAIQTMSMENPVDDYDIPWKEQRKNIRSVIIQEGVTSIGKYTLYNTNVCSITIPNSVTSIGMGAFYGCTALTDVYYGGSRTQWEAVSIDTPDNPPLLNAAIHYNNSSGEPEEPFQGTVLPGATQYRPYAYTVSWDFSHQSGDRYELVSSDSRLTLDADTGELSIVPRTSGTLRFTVRQLRNGTAVAEKTYQLTIHASDLDAAPDRHIETAVGVQDADYPGRRLKTDWDPELLRIRLPAADFQDLYLDGERLYAGTDYDVSADAGHTVLRIDSQSFRDAGTGLHTLAAVFTDGTVVAQNYIQRSWEDQHVSTGSGGGTGYWAGSSVVKRYRVSVNSGRHGRLSASTVNPKEGDRVTLTITPDDGYELDTLTVTAGGREIDVDISGRKAVFDMPAASVVVKAAFRTAESEDDPSGTAGSVPVTVPVETPSDTRSLPLPLYDIPSNYWANQEITWACRRGYMTGYTTTAFNPEGTVTRQQLWMTLARLDGEHPADMAAARTWAVSRGISDGSSPETPITRQQLVTMFYRFAQQSGYNTAGGADLSAYPDAGAVQSYASQAFRWAVGSGLVNGAADGRLHPNGIAVRSQLAVMLYRFCDRIIR